MIRIILRNIRHTLVLSSVLLVVMALQRLHQFEFPLHSASGRIEDFQPGEPYKAGIYHPIVFGRDLKIGLFRFMFPRLEQTQDPSWLPDLDQSSVPKRRRNVIIIMVYIMDCEESSIDAAILLKQNLQRCADKNIKVHGLVEENCRGLNGSNVLFLDRLFNDVVVMDKLANWQTRGHALAHRARLVIKVPLEATVACSDETSIEPPSITTSNIQTMTHRHLSIESTATSDVEWIRPNNNVASNSTLVTEQNAHRCSTYPCQIPTTKIVFDYIFHSDCPRPWECNNASHPSYPCQLSLNHWYSQRTNAFEGIIQPDACDENHNYVPMKRPKRNERQRAIQQPI